MAFHCHHRIDEAITKARIEHDIPSAIAGQILAVGARFAANRRLHPAVHRQDPEGRDKRAKRYHPRCGKVQFFADLVQPEQHDAEKACFKKEHSKHFIGHERAEDWPRHIGEHRPVGAKLVGHNDAGNDTHRKRNRKNFEPVFQQIKINWLACFQPRPLSTAR